RAHLAATALSNPVRRRGEGSSVRSLRVVVSERLQARGIDIDSAEWDAWRNPDRSWTVRGRYHSGSAVHEADFSYDPARRFSVASNDDARWLISESTSAHGPQPGRKRPDPDAEPTVDLNDELALVRATAEGFSPAPIAPPSPRMPGLAPGEANAGVVAPVDDDEEIVMVDDDDEELNLPEYAPIELDEVDGVYDIVPTRANDLDVLYEMLSAFNEDSVNIYAGLTRPTEAAVGTVPAAAVPPVPVTSDSPGSPDSPDSPDSPASPASPVEAIETEAPEQTPLIDTPPMDAPVPTPKPRQTRKKGRASVPSWDEIMFGGPTPKAPS
ncbi:MAG TPA: septation protein SepH, partial [Propionibacteriaceae bacterium]|nr:septation protein SepH [Propionibacteriaceae bacterium]